MNTDTERQNWAALARAVSARRLALGLSQKHVQDAGGPSTAKLREIENHRTVVLAPALRRGLERTLLWSPGSIDQVLAGHAPQHLPDDASATNWRSTIASNEVVQRVARRRAADLLEDWNSPDVRERFLTQARAYLTLALEEVPPTPARAVTEDDRD